MDLVYLPGDLWKREVYPSVNGIDRFMLLAWTPKSSNMVQGVQGRYMLPLLPVFLFTLKNQKVVRTGTDDRLILYTMMAADVYVILRIFAVVCLRL